MATQVLATKLFVPLPRPQSVARTGLIERLRAGHSTGRKLTFVSAPAGFGKTSLLGEWMADVQRVEPDARVAWLPSTMATTTPCASRPICSLP